MNFFPMETERTSKQVKEVGDLEVQELNELQLTLVGGGNVIINFG